MSCPILEARIVMERREEPKLKRSTNDYNFTVELYGSLRKKQFLLALPGAEK
jgi:hypothetical protein